MEKDYGIKRQSKFGAAGAVQINIWRLRTKNVSSAGGTVQVWRGVQKIENRTPPRQRGMDPLVELEAGES